MTKPSSEAPSRRRQKRGVARREEIISAAIEEFSRHGFRGRGIKKLAERLGRSEAGLFHHFGTKADLLLAVLRERHSHGANFFECVSSKRGRASLEAYPEALANVLNEPELAKLAHVLLTESFEPSSPSHEYYVEHRRFSRSRCESRIRQAVDDGDFRQDFDPRIAALTVIAVMDGLQGLFFLDPDQVDTQAAIRMFMAMFLAYCDNRTADQPRRAASGSVPAP